MEINIDKIREKLERLKNPQKFQGSKSAWHPQKDAQNTIRLIKYPHSEDPFVEFWLHYNIGNEPGIPCLKFNKQKFCPACEFADSLKKTNNKEDYAFYKQVRAKQRFYAVMVDRADMTSSPKYWGFSEKIYQKLLENLLDEEYRHFLSPVKGLDLVVTNEQQQGKQYRDIDIKFKRQETRLAESDARIKEIMASVVPFEQVFTFLTEDEIKAKLDTAWSSNGKGNSGGTEVGGTKKKEVDNPKPEFDINSALEKALEN